MNNVFKVALSITIGGIVLVILFIAILLSSITCTEKLYNSDSNTYYLEYSLNSDRANGFEIAVDENVFNNVSIGDNVL